MNVNLDILGKTNLRNLYQRKVISKLIHAINSIPIEDVKINQKIIGKYGLGLLLSCIQHCNVKAVNFLLKHDNLPNESSSISSVLIDILVKNMFNFQIMHNIGEIVKLMIIHNYYQPDSNIIGLFADEQIQLQILSLIENNQQININYTL